MRLAAAAAVLALLACSHAKVKNAIEAANAPTGVEVEDAIHGVRYDLPAGDEIWQVSHEGDARTASGVEAGVSSFPLAAPAAAQACRDHQRDRFGKDSQLNDGAHDQKDSDDDDASWAFTTGTGDAQVRNRLAFFARGSDCLVLHVSGAQGDKFAARTFDAARKSLKVLPLPADRQREIDLLAGMSFLERRDSAAALNRFEALAQREPDLAKAHFGALLAGFELGAKAYRRALPHGLLALRSEHDLSAEQRQLALRAVGVMQLAENQIRDAADTLAELVVRSPDLAEGQYNYACALARLGDAPGAIDHLRKAVQLDGDLITQARGDDDLKSLRGQADFERLISSSSK
jgi:tetratricopeptide (TPR) repeat protein